MSDFSYNFSSYGNSPRNSYSQQRLKEVESLAQKRNISRNSKEFLELLKKYGLDKFVSKDFDITQEENQESAINVADLSFEDGKINLDLNSQENASILDIVNTMLENEEIKESIGLEGELDNITAEEFLTALSGYDGKNSTISFEDIFSALQDIENGDFDLDIEDAAETEEVDSTEDTQPSSPSGGNYKPQNSTDTSSDLNNQPQEKTIANMTEEELNAELQNAQNELTGANGYQTQLNSVLNGSDPEIAALQQNSDDAYKVYQEQLKQVDENLASELDAVVSSITQKESEISSKEIEIANQNITISNCENAYNSAVNKVSAMESQLAHLKSINLADLTPDEQAHITSNISALEAQKAAAIAERDAKKQELDSAKELLTSQEGQKAALENELTTIEAQKAEIEARISQQAPQVQQYMDAYNAAKDKIKTTKTSKTSELKTLIADKQKYITEINTALSAKEAAKIKNEFSDGLLHTNVPTEKIPLTESLEDYDPNVKYLGWKEPDSLKLFNEQNVADNNPFASGKDANIKANIDGTLADLNVDGDISYKRLSDGTYIVEATSKLDLNHGLKITDGSAFVGNIQDTPTTSYYQMTADGRLIGYQSPIGTFTSDGANDIHMRYKGDNSHYFDMKIDTPLYLDDIVRQITQPSNDIDAQQLMYVMYGHHKISHKNGCQTQVAHAYNSGIGFDAKFDSTNLRTRLNADTTDIETGDIVYQTSNLDRLQNGQGVVHEGIFFLNIPLNNGLTMGISADFATNHVYTTPRFIEPGAEGQQQNEKYVVYNKNTGKLEYQRRVLRTASVVD